MKKPKHKARANRELEPPRELPANARLLERAFARAKLQAPRELARSLAEFDELADRLADGNFGLGQLPGREELRIRVTVSCERLLKGDVSKAMIRSLLREIQDEKEAAEAAAILDPWLDGQQLPQHNALVSFFLRKWGETLDERAARWLAVWLEDAAEVPTSLSLEALTEAAGHNLAGESPPLNATERASLQAAVAPALDWPEPVRQRLLAQTVWKWAESYGPTGDPDRRALSARRQLSRP